MTNTNLTAATAWVLLLLLVGGCAQTPPSDFYVLTPTAQTTTRTDAPGQASLSVSIGPVKIPDYLNRGQIVTRAGQNRLDVNEFHRWGGGLAANISAVVAENLSVLLGTDDVSVFPTQDPVSPRYRVSLTVSKFDGVLGESAILDARWVITGSARSGPLATGRTVIEEAPLGGDYDAYVAAQSRTLAALSRDIATEITRLLDAGS